MFLVMISDDCGELQCTAVLRDEPSPALLAHLKTKYHRVEWGTVPVCESEKELELLCRECCEPEEFPQDM